MKQLTQCDRITYSETVRVNIGDYEHRDVFLSYATDVAPGETPQSAVARAKKVVLDEVRKVEKKIRTNSAKHVDFDTMKKSNIR